MSSIRSRLTRNLLLGMLVLIVLSGTALYLSIRSLLIRQFDASLESQARLFASLTEQGEDEIELEFAEESPGHSGVSRSDEFYQCWLAGGETLERSKTLGDRDLPRRTGGIDDPDYFNFTLPDGWPARAIGVRFAPRPEDHKEGSAAALPPKEVEMVVARGRAMLDEALAIVLFGLLITGFLLAAGAAWTLSRGIRTGLQPLSRLAHETAAMDASTLAARFPVAGLPSELAPIVEQLNALLHRLDEAFRRERRLTADLAHELRTPIAELRSLAEVALRWPEDAEMAKRGLEDALDIAIQMERLAGVFLDLARSGMKDNLINAESVEVGDLFITAWLPFADQARARDLHIDFQLDRPIEIQTDRTLLLSILRNLFSNAVDCTPPGGRIEGRLRPEGGSVDIVLTNSNNSLSSGDIAHIFEPLWRKEAARTNNGHAGLGLTLVQNFAQILGGEARARLLDDKSFEMTVRIKHREP